MAKLKGTDDIIFANLFLACGVNNGVVNLTFGAFLFTPEGDDKKIDPDPTITARLRLDEPCARAMYEELGKLLDNIATTRALAANPQAVPEQPGDKLN